MKTDIFLVRHGETVWNSLGKFQGQQDSPLTPHGIAQAQAVGRRLKRESIQAVYSSDLGRSASTAAHIVAETGHSVLLDARFRERHYGIFEGLTAEQAQERYPEIRQADRSNNLNYAVPEGESRQTMLDRVWLGLEELASRHLHQTIVVVTHGAVLSGVLRQILGTPFDGRRSFRLRNGSLHHVIRDELGWLVEMMGESSHLHHLQAGDSRG